MAAAAREKILRYYRGSEGEETAVKLVDLAEQVERSQKFRLTNFLTPLGQDILETIAANFPWLAIDFNGGYLGAESQRAIIRHRDFGGHPDFELSVVEAVWNGSFVRLSHRDVLGAVMGLGVERDRIGDIIATGESAKIITDLTMADYFCANLRQIGSAAVTCQIGDLREIAPREVRSKEINATVASLRVDAIAAAGFGFSRSRAAADIAAAKLKLNWQEVKNATQSVKEGDMLSMRGRGRLEVAEVRGTTKKGRIGVLLKRYI